MSNFTQSQIEVIQSSLSPVDDDVAYVDFLDDVYGDVTIAGYTYSTSRALSEVDPVAYRCGHADFISMQLEEQWTEVAGQYYDTAEIEDLIEQLTSKENI